MGVRNCGPMCTNHYMHNLGSGNRFHSDILQRGRAALEIRVLSVLDCARMICRANKSNRSTVNPPRAWSVCMHVVECAAEDLQNEALQVHVSMRGRPVIQSGHHMTTRVHPEPCRLEMGPIKRWCVVDGVTSIRPVHESVAQKSRQCKNPLCMRLKTMCGYTAGAQHLSQPHVEASVGQGSPDLGPVVQSLQRIS